MVLKISVVAALAAVVVAVAWVGGAGAHSTKFASSLELTDWPDTDGDGTPESVIGRVSSPKAKCVRGRTVNIFWIGNSDDPEGSMILIDTVRTDREGLWQGGNVEPIGRGGRVKVVRKNIGRKGHKHVCQASVAVYD